MGIPVGGSPRTRESESLPNSAAGLGDRMGVPYGVVDGANPMGAGSIQHQHPASCRTCDAVRCMKQLCCQRAHHAMDTKHAMSWDIRYMFPLNWSHEVREAQADGNTVDLGTRGDLWGGDISGSLSFSFSL